jgi:hypothetical protein
MLQDNVVTLAGQNTKLDAEAQEAKAAQRRTELEKVQLRLQYENLGRNNKWLEENMSHLNDALKTERQKAAQQVGNPKSDFRRRTPGLTCHCGGGICNLKVHEIVF